MTQKKKGFQGTTLKLIAITAMLIDHIGCVLLENGLLPILASAVIAGSSTGFLPKDYQTFAAVDTVLRLIGRIAFPIFCFLLVEGFCHTRSVRNYALRLGCFALISEIPFDLATNRTLYYPGYQNVFFTLLLGLLVLAGIRFAADCLPAAQPRQKVLLFLCQLLILLTGCALASLLHTDYSAFGILAIAFLYLLRNNRKRQCVVGALLFLWELSAPLAFLILYHYNGERGATRSRYGFYLFYPVHLLLLVLLRLLLF